MEDMDAKSTDEIEDDRAQRLLGLAASAATAVQYASPLAEFVKVRAGGVLVVCAVVCRGAPAVLSR